MSAKSEGVGQAMKVAGHRHLLAAGLAVGMALGGCEGTEAGRTSSWRNPRTGSGGEVTVDQARTRDGQQCRNFVHAIKARNESAPLQAEGLACRQADGSWTVFGS